MRESRSFLGLTLLLSTLVLGESRAQEADEQEELSQFLELLAQQTTLATNTRLNADYVPGMVSVLDHAQMQRRGFRTLWEALASLPGVQTSIDETGMRSIGVRGVGGSSEPAKVKLLLNDQPVNPSASASTATYYDMRVEQIERVEFIRGPGSAIHGEFAYAGVINVLTRKTGQYYSAGLDSNRGVDFGALYSHASPGGDFRSSFSLSASDSDGEDIDSGRDASLAGNPGYAPGPINNKRDFVSAIVDLDFDGLNALFQYQQANRGDHFGANNLLPPDEKQTVISETLFNASLSQAFRLGDDIDAEWSLGVTHHQMEKNRLFLGVAETFGGLGDEDDVFADVKLAERRVEAGVALQAERGAHSLFGEISVVDIEVTDSEQLINLDPVTNLPTATSNAFPGPVDETQQRRSMSLVLQDEYRVDDRLTLTTGLRYDDYEDIGSNLSPRIAAVWRRSDYHVFKTQLARAFRPPSLIETGGAVSPSIEAETNDTLEFGHIYQGNSLVVRNTVYFSRLDDLIVFQDRVPFGYHNSGGFDLRGYELEIEKSISSQWEIVANLSLQDYADDSLPGAAPWMFKLGAGYRLRPLTRLHLQFNAWAARERAPGDPRDDFEQSEQLDLSLRSQDILEVAGLDLRLGISNLLDQRLELPAPAGTYAADYPYSDGATLWLQLSFTP